MIYQTTKAPECSPDVMVPNEPKPKTGVDVLPKGVVVIAGGGPIGLLLARVLSFYGVRSKLFERNKTTTK